MFIVVPAGYLILQGLFRLGITKYGGNAAVTGNTTPEQPVGPPDNGPPDNGPPEPGPGPPEPGPPGPPEPGPPGPEPGPPEPGPIPEMALRDSQRRHLNARLPREMQQKMQFYMMN